MKETFDLGDYFSKLRICQDVYTIPGFDKVFNGASMLKLHNLAVEQGALQQLLLWIGLLEIISGVPAIIQVRSQPGSAVIVPRPAVIVYECQIFNNSHFDLSRQTLSGSERTPGDFGFDPLGCAKDPNAFARRQVA